VGLVQVDISSIAPCPMLFPMAFIPSIPSGRWHFVVSDECMNTTSIRTYPDFYFITWIQLFRLEYNRKLKNDCFILFCRECRRFLSNIPKFGWKGFQKPRNASAISPTEILLQDSQPTAS
jgi:hypothetical protein